jgi:hypothetical protein
MPGFKDFNAGDILTADQVDDFLMRQTVMVFDDASARDTALASVLREGMMCYLKSDDTLLQYTGSQWEQAGAPTWLTQYPSGTPETASTLSGQVLMTTGGTATPIWQAHPSHNYIINGAFDVWQRGTSFTSIPSATYFADRMFQSLTINWDIERSTDAPTGFRFSAKIESTGGSTIRVRQPLESAEVIPLRGKTMTFSSYVKKAGSFSGNNLNYSIRYSTSTDAAASQTTNVNVTSFPITSDWARNVVSFTVPADAAGLELGWVTSGQPSGAIIYTSGAFN